MYSCLKMIKGVGVVKKKLLIGVLIMVLTLGVGTALALDPIRIVVNGIEVTGDTQPLIINGRTMVPIRLIAEALDAEVDYDAVQRKVIVNAVANKQQETWKLMKVNGEMTTWPYWEKDGLLYMEYRNCIDLLEMKYITPWHKVSYNSVRGAINIDQKSIPVYTKTIGDYTCIALDDLKRQGHFIYEWDAENGELKFE